MLVGRPPERTRSAADHPGHDARPCPRLGSRSRPDRGGAGPQASRRRTNSDSAQLTTLTTRAPQNAAQKPSTVNGAPTELLTAAVSQNSSALTTSANSPRVSTSSGQDS